VDTDVATSDTQALATQGRDLGQYKRALVKAKDKQLPELFKKVKDVHENLAKWMKAALIPLKAQSKGMKDSISKIDERIHSVELYAGLTEHVVQIRKGNPAPKDAKLHLLQRIHYMDEECLLKYEAGGMTFRNIKDFDRWLAKKDNRDRLLPFTRCCLAFQIRRYQKQRKVWSFSQFINFLFDDSEKENDRTFLYIRNGAQLYRLETSLEFSEKLFPDTERSVFGAEKLLAKRDWNKFELVSEREYAAMMDKYAEDCVAWEKKQAEHKKVLRAWKKLPKEGRGAEPWLSPFDRPDYPGDYEPYDPTNLDYDDITTFLNVEIKHYNRIGLLLQGLFDRSEVLHPHPKAKLWTTEGFDKAVVLVFDKDRALVSGPKPDFKAYRDGLNEKLKRGSVTVGQQELWLQDMAVKEGWRREASYLTHYKPEGNPGPGLLAKVASLGRTGKATFSWTRQRSWQGDEQWKLRKGYRRFANIEVPGVNTSWSCDTKSLFNVDAYTPGDFKQFFEDPRTRADYAQWAPLMLAAEDYHAGKRKVGKDE
jgi:hypothetical protein